MKIIPYLYTKLNTNNYISWVHKEARCDLHARAIISNKGSDNIGKYTAVQREETIALYDAGKTVVEIVAATNIPRSTVYAWLHNEKAKDEKRVDTPGERMLIRNKVARLESIIEILQTAECTANASLGRKLAELEQLYGKYSVHALCDALKIPRGTFYNYILRNKRDNTWYAKRREDLREHIQKVYDDSHQIFGADKITAVLKEYGVKVSPEMVRELMADIGSISIRQDAKKQYDKEKRQKQNHLDRQFTASRPNEVWVSDVTYFRYNEKKFYICAIMDLYARKIIACRISMKNSTQLAKSTFKSAYESRRPEAELLFHTDRGTSYQSKTFCNYLSERQVVQSFSRTGSPYDNAVMESFFASMKREALYRIKYRSGEEFRAAVANYITFYNEKRPHARNGYKTPAKMEQDYWDKCRI